MNERLYIRDVARVVDRRESTVRSWCRSGRLPSRLQPRRVGTHGWRYWTPAQVRGIQRWMVEQKMIPGSGLRNYDMTVEQQDELLESLRRPRRAA